MWFPSLLSLTLPRGTDSKRTMPKCHIQMCSKGIFRNPIHILLVQPSSSASSIAWCVHLKNAFVAGSGTNFTFRFLYV